MVELLLEDVVSTIVTASVGSTPELKSKVRLVVPTACPAR